MITGCFKINSHPLTCGFETVINSFSKLSLYTFKYF